MNEEALYTLQEHCHLQATPAGAYYAIQANKNDPVRAFLRHILAQGESVELSSSELTEHLDKDIDSALTILHRMQSMGYLQAFDEPYEKPTGPLEQILPPFLESVVDTGKAILSDEQGFYISATGFNHETAEELSALGANLLRANERHQQLLNNNLGLSSTAWGIVNPAGNCEIGFWPLYLPRDRFTLILSGIPQFNTQEFTQLITCLSMRYNN